MDERDESQLLDEGQTEAAARDVDTPVISLREIDLEDAPGTAAVDVAGEPVRGRDVDVDPAARNRRVWLPRSLPRPERMVEHAELIAGDHRTDAVDARRVLG